jgi:hypothetical protein
LSPSQVKPKTMKLVFYFFSAKNAALRTQSKDGFTQNKYAHIL